MTHPLQDFRAPEPLLVLVDDSTAVPQLLAWPDSTVIRLSELAGVSARAADGRPVVKRGQKSVLLVTRDRATLRKVRPLLPRMGQVRVVACWLWGAAEPLVVAPAPGWPRLTSAMAREAGDGSLSVLRFAAPVPVHVVLAECAAQAVAGFDGHGGLVVSAGHHPGQDPDYDPERDVPPDVIITHTALDPSPHHVIDRAPVVVAPLAVPPIDELVINPMGWRKDWSTPVADVASLDLGSELREADLPRLRDLQGVRVELGTTPTALVAGLAAAGVPLLASGSDSSLGSRLSAALAQAPDLDDGLAREEHSVTVRRAALDEHSDFAWRTALAAGAGVRMAGLGTVSVMLPTMRPHQLEFALRQIARQVDAHLEVIVSTHGFVADPGQVRAVLGDRPVTLLDHPAETFFGDVLDAAAQAASGDVLLKVDDDDWYGPHFVHDLLWARRYSRAEVVGTPSEFVYLEELGVTAQRNHPTETFNRFVAGGSIMAERSVVRSVGGFRRVRRFVDAQFLDAVLAGGGRIYRAHGLGYVLRRTGSGHTWQSDPQSFRRADIVAREWPGFHTSAELAVRPEDLP